MTTGTRLVLVGEGFPAGRRCEVVFDGQVHRPGASRQTVRANLQGKALSGELLQVVLDRAALKRLGSRGSFEGMVRVAFATADGDAQVTGTLGNVQLDLVDQSIHRSAAQLRARRAQMGEAKRFLQFAGIGTDGAPGGLNSKYGVLIERIRPGSPASAAGMSSGDAIVRAGSIRVRSIRDLVPEPGAQQMGLSVVREGISRPIEARIALRGLYQSPLQAATLRFASLAVLLLLVLVFLSPLSRFIERIFTGLVGDGSLSRAQSARGRGLWAIWGSGRKKRARGYWLKRGRTALVVKAALRLESALRLVVAPMAASAFLVALVFNRRLVGVDVDPLLICLGVMGFGVGAALMDAGQRRRRSARGSSPDSSPDSLLGSLQRSWIRRAKTAAGHLLWMTMACFGVLCACALGATRSLDGIVAMQGGLPWQWMVFKNPAMALAFPLYLAGCSGFTFPDVDPRQAGKGKARAAEIFGGLLLCGIGAAVFFGGWQTVGIPYLQQFDPRLSGPVVFVVKAWAMGFVVHVAISKRLARLITMRGAAIMVVLCALITSAWIGFKITVEVEAVTGYTTFAATVLALASALVRSRTRQASPDRLAADMNPFL